MRAEAQAHADQINAALALLRRFLDWDRALRRLDELNAKVEDSSLWDDPKAAQEVMRERRRLEEAINATRAIERELAALTNRPQATSVATWHLQHTEELMHFTDVVGAIVTDFRGMDTIIESTVFAVAALGVLTILARPPANQRWPRQVAAWRST